MNPNGKVVEGCDKRHSIKGKKRKKGVQTIQNQENKESGRPSGKKTVSSNL